MFFVHEVLTIPYFQAGQLSPCLQESQQGPEEWVKLCMKNMFHSASFTHATKGNVSDYTNAVKLFCLFTKWGNLISIWSQITFIRVMFYRSFILNSSPANETKETIKISNNALQLIIYNNLLFSLMIFNKL